MVCLNPPVLEQEGKRNMQKLCGNILLTAFLGQYRTSPVHDNFSKRHCWIIEGRPSTHFDFNILMTALTDMKPEAALSASVNDIVKTDTVDSLSSFWQKWMSPTFCQTPSHNACWLNCQNYHQTCQRSGDHEPQTKCFYCKQLYLFIYFFSKFNSKTSGPPSAVCDAAWTVCSARLTPRSH